jgi:hypothetical protein
MSYTFTCPDCVQPIQAEEDTVGLHGRCPYCSATFTIPEPALDRSFSTHQKEQHGLSPGWLTLRNGLLLYGIGLRIAMFVLVAAVLLLAVTAGLGSIMQQRTELVVQAAVILTGLTLVGAMVLMIVGQCLCCAVPEEAATRGSAIGSVACLSLGTVLEALVILGTVALQRNPRGPRADLGSLLPAVTLMAILLNASSHVLFSLFLKGTARFFQNGSLAASVTAYLLVYGVFLLSGLLLAVLLFLVRLSSPDALQVSWHLLFLGLGVGFLVFALVLIMWFLDLVRRMRSTIARSLSEIWKS